MTTTPFSRIVSGSALIACVTLLVRAVAFGREILTASELGVGGTLDLYLVAFLVPSFFIFSITACAGSALIPIVMLARQQGGAAAVHRVIARINGAALWAFAGFAALAALIAPLCLPLLAASVAPEHAALVRLWLLLLSLLIPVYGFAALWTAIANAHGNLVIPAAVPVITPLITIVLLQTLAARYGAWALVAGVMAGAFLELMVIGLLLRARRLLGTPVFSFVREKNHERSFATLFAGTAIANIAPLAAQAMAAMTGSGGITQIAYGGRLTSLIFSVGALALGYSALPVFSALAVEEKWRELRALALRSVLLTLAIATPSCLLFAWHSTLIVRIVYQHGNFSAADTAPVALVQAIYLLQMPFALCWIILSSVLAAMRRQTLLLTLNAGGVALFTVILGAGLSRWPLQEFGVTGIAAATSLTTILMFLVVSGMTHRGLNRKIQVSE